MRRPIEIGQMWTSVTGNVWVVQEILDESRALMRLKGKWHETAVFHKTTLELPAWKQLGDENVFDFWISEQRASDIEEGKVSR